MGWLFNMLRRGLDAAPAPSSGHYISSRDLETVACAVASARESLQRVIEEDPPELALHMRDMYRDAGQCDRATAVLARYFPLPATPPLPVTPPAQPTRQLD